jgi:hypothetical protein
MGLHFQGDRHLKERIDKRPLLISWQVEEPATSCRAVHVQVKPATAQVIDRQAFVVALHRVEPRLSEPVECLRTVRPAVDQVADTEEAIDRRVEADAVQALLQALEVPVDITHGQVAPAGVGGYPPETAHCFVPLLRPGTGVKWLGKPSAPGGASCVPPWPVPY